MWVVLLGLLVALALFGALLAGSAPTVRPAGPPYLTAFCDLASLDEVRAILGNEGAVVVHGEGRSNHTGLDACVWRAEVPRKRVLGVWDWAPSMFDDARAHPGSYVPDGTLTPVADGGDDAFLLTTGAEADLYIKKGARAAWVYYRPTDAEDAARLRMIATQMGGLVAERMSGAPSAVGDLCQLLTPEDFQVALQWTEPYGTSFATHCDWNARDPIDPMAGYLSVYDVPVPDFDAAKSLGGDPVSGMGDEAFILTVDNQPTLYIRKGDRATAISTPHYNDAVQQYGPDDELKIGTIVADRLATAPFGTSSTPAATAATSPSVAWQPAEPTALFDVSNAAAALAAVRLLRATPVAQAMQSPLPRT